MNFNATFREFIARRPDFFAIALHVIFIAIVFEILAWWLGHRVEKMTTPFLGLDAGRDPKWRSIRRAALRQTPKVVLRTVLYTVALILVLDAFGLKILPISLALGAVALLFGAAFLPMMRDYAQGYALLSEDALAPGDVVGIGRHRGTVEKWTLRATWLRDGEDRLHTIFNGEVREVVVFNRAGVEETSAFDPLPPAPATPSKMRRKGV